MKKRSIKDKLDFSSGSVGRKLGLAFGVLIILIVSFTILTYNLNKSIQTDAKFIREVNAPLSIMVEQVIGYDGMLTGNAHWALLHSINGETVEVTQHKKEYDEVGARLDKLLKVDAKALISKSRRSTKQKELVYEYLKQLDEINLKLVRLELSAFDAMERGNNDEAYSLIGGETYHRYKQELLSLYKKWGVAEAEIAEYYRQRILLNSLKAKILNEFFGIIFILIAIITPILIFKAVVTPINELEDIAKEISSGNLDIKITTRLKKDKSEIGSLARTFDTLIKSSHFALKTFVESKFAKKEKELTQREKELSLREKMEQKYRILFENATDAIFIADAKTKQLVDCNKAAEKLMGYSRTKILSMKADALHPRDRLKETMKGFKEQVEGKIKAIFTEVLTKNHERIPVEISAAAVRIGDKMYNQGIFKELKKEKKK